jgi:hypothetical protein
MAMYAPRAMMNPYGRAQPVMVNPYGGRVMGNPYGGRVMGNPYMVAPQPQPQPVPEPVKAIDNPMLMYLMFDQSSSALGLNSEEATLWNMGHSGAFGGDLPTSALFGSTLGNSQSNAADNDQNVLALMTAMGQTSNSGDYYSPSSAAGVMDPTVMGQVMRHYGAQGQMNDNYLATLLTSGGLGLGTRRAPGNPFMMGQLLANGNGGNGDMASFATTMMLTSNTMGTGVYPGTF